MSLRQGFVIRQSDRPVVTKWGGNERRGSFRNGCDEQMCGVIYEAADILRERHERDELLTEYYPLLGMIECDVLGECGVIVDEDMVSPILEIECYDLTNGGGGIVVEF